MMNTLFSMCRVPAMLLLSATLYSCGGAAPMTAERKKLPGDDQYAVIVLADPADDSATISLINTYKPIAIPMVTEWAQQHKSGVAIDFRQNEFGQLQRSEYLVQRENAFRLPVVFLWDNASAGRASYFMNMLESYKAVNVNRISGTSNKTGFGSCFHP